LIDRGGVYEVDFPAAGFHPAVVVTRQEAIPVLSSVTVAQVTSTRRGHPAEVELGGGHLELVEGSVVNCDNLVTLPKQRIGKSMGYLSTNQLADLDRALKIALDLG
jgi:mRNA interferase MazF